MTSFKIATLVFAVLLVATIGLARPQKQLVSTAGEEASARSAFRLGAGDTIEVRFLYDPELNDTVQIQPDGHVSLQMIGDVNLESLTIAEATSMLEKLYLKYLKTPSITVQVRGYASQKVYVGGEVNRPGVVPIPGQMSVLDAVIAAGYITHDGNNSLLILIRRSNAGTPVIHKISLKSIDNEPSQASLTMLEPYDVILVPETKVAHVDRWVDQHVRQIIPVIVTAGFSYLAGTSVVR